MEPFLFTRLAVAEAELQAMKDLLAEVLDKLAEVEASQDELRQDCDEWRGRAERLLTDQRRPWWRRVVGRVISLPDRCAEAASNRAKAGAGSLRRVGSRPR